MASYETEFLRALNMASQSASGLLKAIREPDYEEKLAMETEKRKELQRSQAEINLEFLDKQQQFGAGQSDLDRDLKRELNTENNQTTIDVTEKKITSTEKMSANQIASNKYIAEGGWASNEKITRMNNEYGLDKIELHGQITEKRDNLLQGFKVENMNLQTTNVMKVAAHQGIVDAKLFENNAKVKQQIGREDVEFMLEFNTLAPVRQAELMDKEYIDPITGEGTGKTHGEMVISYTTKTHALMKDANFRQQLKDAEGKPVRDYIYQNMPVLNYVFDPTPSQRTFYEGEKEKDFDFNMNLQNEAFNNSLGQQLMQNEMFGGIPDKDKTSILSSAQGQSAMYGNMDLDNPVTMKAINTKLSFDTDNAIARLNQSYDSMQFPDQPSTLFRGDKAHSKFLTEGANVFNDLSANLLVRSQALADIGITNASKSFKKELKQDLLQGIKRAERLKSSAKKVKDADKGLIESIENKQAILQSYYDQIN